MWSVLNVLSPITFLTPCVPKPHFFLLPYFFTISRPSFPSRALCSPEPFPWVADTSGYSRLVRSHFRRLFPRLDCFAADSFSHLPRPAYTIFPQRVAPYRTPFEDHELQQTPLLVLAPLSFFFFFGPETPLIPSDFLAALRQSTPNGPSSF